jgi:hypothetical protein
MLKISAQSGQLSALVLKGLKLYFLSSFIFTLGWVKAQFLV